jgi:hypothetical protein
VTSSVREFPSSGCPTPFLKMDNSERAIAKPMPQRSALSKPNRTYRDRN